MIDAAFAELEPLTSTTYACDTLGKSRSTVHRQRNPKPKMAGPRPAPAPHPAQLTEAEQQHVLAVLNSPRFCDKAPAQVWAFALS